jgi:toxin ParE1/3/4
VVKYRFRPQARHDVEAIWEHTLNTWGEAQARRYVTQLHDVCEALAANPRIGRMRDEVIAGLRSFPSGKHLVFYLVVPDGIEVIRILHERMDPDTHLS